MIKVLIFQLIDKSPINLVSVKILIFSTIIYVFYTILGFHKVNISDNIAFAKDAVEFFLVTDIFINVYIII